MSPFCAKTGSPRVTWVIVKFPEPSGRIVATLLPGVPTVSGLKPRNRPATYIWPGMPFVPGLTG